MRFDIDASSKHAELFFETREFIMSCIGEDAKEKLSQNITSYSSKDGGFCYIRTTDEYLHIGWFRGTHINDKYNNFFGNGKAIRGHKFKKLDAKQKEAITYYIEQTKLYLIEHNELMLMKKALKQASCKKIPF